MQHWVFPNQHQVDDFEMLEMHGTNDKIVVPQEGW